MYKDPTWEVARYFIKKKNYDKALVALLHLSKIN
jgi:hypothetical protein